MQPIPSSLNRRIEPRYASLPNIMKAKKKPIEKVSAQELGVDLTPRLVTIKVTEPPKRVGGKKVRPHYDTVVMMTELYFIPVKVGNVDELIEKLKEAGIIAA